MGGERCFQFALQLGQFAVPGIFAVAGIEAGVRDHIALRLVGIGHHASIVLADTCHHGGRISGMIGMLFGYLGAKFDLSKAVTITRVLVIVVTVREVILSSEGEIATHYVVWFRSLAGIGFLHWAFARKIWRASPAPQMSAPRAPGGAPRPYPNLLA